jgi:hypothetical protein
VDADFPSTEKIWPVERKSVRIGVNSKLLADTVSAVSNGELTALTVEVPEDPLAPIEIISAYTNIKARAIVLPVRLAR